MVRAAALEPVVGNTSTVSRQVFERVQPVKVIDRYLCHGLGFGKTQIDGNAAASLLILLPRAPEGYAAANQAKVELNGFSSYAGPSLA